MGAEFGECLAITVEGLHRGQSSPQLENAEGATHLPAGFIATLAIQLLAFDIHLIGFPLPGHRHPEAGHEPEFGGP